MFYTIILHEVDAKAKIMSVNYKILVFYTFFIFERMFYIFLWLVKLKKKLLFLLIYFVIYYILKNTLYLSLTLLNIFNLILKIKDYLNILLKKTYMNLALSRSI